MMRSLGSGVSGLRNHQVKMDVIAHNIANVNTTGFKGGRVNFQEILSQNIRGNSMSNIGTDSVNPAQIGLGVATQSIDMLFSQGAPQTTNRVLDNCIDGNGFFLVGKWGVVEDADDGGDPTMGIIEYFYTRDGSFYLNDEGYLVNSAGLYVLGVGDPDEGWLNEEEISQVLNGTYRGRKTDGNGDAIFPYERIRLYAPEGLSEDYDGDDPLDFPDNLTTLRIDPNGLVFVNGRTDRAALILVDNYGNPESLTKAGSNLFEVPMDGDIPASTGWGVPGSSGGQGKLISGALEMSNVDLSNEFAEMIKTQRGYQANARVITVSDEMLGELINLKR